MLVALFFFPTPLLILANRLNTNIPYLYTESAPMCFLLLLVGLCSRTRSTLHSSKCSVNSLQLRSLHFHWEQLKGRWQRVDFRVIHRHMHKSVVLPHTPTEVTRLPHTAAGCIPHMLVLKPRCMLVLSRGQQTHR